MTNHEYTLTLSISSFSVHFLILLPLPYSLATSSFSVYFVIFCPFPHSLSISSFSLHFLAARLQGSSGLRNPDVVDIDLSCFCFVLKKTDLQSKLVYLRYRRPWVALDIYHIVGIYQGGFFELIHVTLFQLRGLFWSTISNV